MTVYPHDIFPDRSVPKVSPIKVMPYNNKIPQTNKQRIITKYQQKNIMSTKLFAQGLKTKPKNKTKKTIRTQNKTPLKN